MSFMQDKIINEIEIVNSIYPGSTELIPSFKNTNINVKMGICIEVDGEIRLVKGTESLNVKVEQLPPVNLTISIPLNDTLKPTVTFIQFVGKSTTIQHHLNCLIEETDSTEDVLILLANELTLIDYGNIELNNNQNFEEVINILMAHDSLCKLHRFNNETFSCHICLGNIKGYKCYQLSCQHVFCKYCLNSMLNLHIKEGSIECLKCPSIDCSNTIDDLEIRNNVTDDFYERYKNLKMKKQYEGDPKVVYCPQWNCQTPVPRPVENEGLYDERGNRLRICSSCNFSFCCYCLRTWHGPTVPCPLTSNSRNFIMKYMKSKSNRERQEMEMKYSKPYLEKLVKEFVESEANRKVIESTTQECPNCFTRTEKISGCNHMVCKCGMHYCNMCGTRLIPSNPYIHFNTPGTDCYMKLFDNTILENVDSDDNGDEDLEQDDDEELRLALLQIGINEGIL